MKNEEKILFSVSRGETENDSVINANIHGRDDAYKVANGIYQLIKINPAMGELIIDIWKEEVEEAIEMEKAQMEMPDFDEILKNIK